MGSWSEFAGCRLFGQRCLRTADLVLLRVFSVVQLRMWVLFSLPMLLPPWSRLYLSSFLCRFCLAWLLNYLCIVAVFILFSCSFARPVPSRRLYNKKSFFSSWLAVVVWHHLSFSRRWSETWRRSGEMCFSSKIRVFISRLRLGISSRVGSGCSVCM